ncbi:MAG: toxic anion resistance protein [Eubacteriales bacterium]|nr:toxic anion resistance protein [Eubacteriales bacterium]
MANENSVPNLTLDPSPAAVAAQELSIEEEINQAAEQIEAVEQEVKEEIVPEKLELEKLSAEEQAAVKEFAAKIDVSNSEQVMNYGAAAQKNISEFSDAALNTVKTKDMGEVGDMLTSLVTELKGFDFDEEEKKGFLGLFKKSKKSLESLKTSYDSAEKNVDKIVEQLENHEITLLKDISLMDKMYDKNEEYQKELTMYIIAGKLRIQDLRENDLVEMQNKAKETGLTEDAQAASDFANLIGRFEKKIYDLELTRMIAVQMAPQIRMIQNNDSLMVEKIRTSINNTIPLWKNQMVLGMTMYNSDEAMKAQNAVTEVTNDLLEKNAETLHQGSVSIAKEAERGIVDLETLQKTNLELISTLEEVRQIQDDGRARRAQAEAELEKIEGELKQKLLALKG